MLSDPIRHCGAGTRPSRAPTCERLEPRRLLAALPAPARDGDGLEAAYFDNADFTDAKLSRVDGEVNFFWSSGSPSDRVGADTFSVRWTGKVKPRHSSGSQTYYFSTYSDEGVRVWINGTKVLDDWSAHSTRWRKGSGISLEAGKIYDIKVDYYDKAGNATMQLAWESSGMSRRTVPRSNLYSVSGLFVEGTRIVNSIGQNVTLQGANVPDLNSYWTAEFGDKAVDAARHTYDEWNANVVRLPVNQSYWMGFEQYQNGPEAYRQQIDRVVELARQKGKYVVFDLQHTNRGQATHAAQGLWAGPDYISNDAFWPSAADRYGDNPHVLFDLFNEWKGSGQGVTDDVWRWGGTVTDGGHSWWAPGMQLMIDTVRGRGADNLILAGGKNWGHELMGVTNGGNYLLDNKGGNGVAYSTHVYPWYDAQYWDTSFGNLASKAPLVVGEFGHDGVYSDGNPNDADHDDDSRLWLQQTLFPYVEARNAGRIAWSMTPDDGGGYDQPPNLVTSYSTWAPTSYYGAYVKSWYLGNNPVGPNLAATPALRLAPSPKSLFSDTPLGGKAAGGDLLVELA